MEKYMEMPSGLSVSIRLSCVITRLLLLGKTDKALSESQILGWACRNGS